MPDNPSSTQPLTVTADGTPPQRRIVTAAGAWKSYQDAIATSRLDDLRFASIRGINDRLPPVDPQELRDQGLDNAPNINLGQFSSKVDTYVSTWTDHNCSGDRMADLQYKRINFNTVEEWTRANEYGKKCFNDCIKLWETEEIEDLSPFICERVICDKQMGLFGIGVLKFQDAIDWRPKAVPSRKVRPSRGTKVTLNNCQALFIDQSYTVSELWNYVRDEKVAKETNWNREPVIKILYERSKTTAPGTSTFETLAEWENRVRNNDTYLQYDFRLIELVDCYFKEFNTKERGEGISHYVVPREGGADPEFLYERDREFKRWSEIIIPFCDSVGPEGEWHGVKGFGDSIYDGCHLNNLLYNQTVLAAIMTMQPMFQAGDESDREKLKQIVFTRLGILFPDVAVSQVKIEADISAALAVLGESNRVINTNTRIFPQNDAQPGGEQPTATQVSFDRQDQAAFTSLQIKFYRLTGADRLFAEMYRRISQSPEKYPKSWPGGHAAAEFRKRMKEYGITPKQYQDPQFVRANRSGGSGNMALDGQKADMALQVATPGRGQNNARKEKLRALYGDERVEEFFEDEAPPTPEDVVIQLENTTLQQGQFIEAFPFQPAERHLGDPSPEGKGHLAVLAATLMAARQIDEAGIETALQDAMKLAKVLEATLQHCAEHTKFLMANPQNEMLVKNLSKVLIEARGFTMNFAKSIERAVQTQQGEQQPQMDAKSQAVLMKAQADIEALKLKTMAEIQTEAMKQQLRLEGMQQTAESRRILKEADAAQKLGIDAEKALIQQQRDAISLETEKKKADAKTRAKKNTKPNEPR